MNLSNFLTQSNASLTSTISHQSASPHHSTAHLTASNASKDYSSAFAQLQSMYGIGGHGPTPFPTKRQMRSTSSRDEAASPATSSSTLPHPEKEFSTAFAHLQLQYGFGGNTPNLLVSFKSPKSSTKAGLTSHSASSQTRDPNQGL